MQHAVGDLHKRVEQQGLLLGMLMAQQEQQAQQAQQDSGSLAKAADALTQQRVQQLAAQLEAERHQRQRLEGRLGAGCCAPGVLCFRKPWLSAVHRV